MTSHDSYLRAATRADRRTRIVDAIAVAFWACMMLAILGGLFAAAFVL